MQNIDKKLAYLNLFLVYGGYYMILGLIFLYGLKDQSRIFTIPLRASVCLGAIILLLKNLNRVRFSILHILLIYFWSCYFFNIVIKALLLEDTYNEPSEILMYFVGLCIIPATGFLPSQNKEFYQRAFWAVHTSFLAFTLAVVVIYRQILAQGIDIRQARYHSFHIEFLNPLSVGYSASYVILLSITVFIFTSNRKVKLYSVFSIIIALVTLLLGASRGPTLVIIVFMPILLIRSFISGTESEKRASIIIGIVLILFVPLVISKIQFGTLFERFSSIFEDIEGGRSSAIRIIYWQVAWEEFKQNPVLGGSLELPGYGETYPHNVIIESFMATGLIGALPFVILNIWSVYLALSLIGRGFYHTWVSIFFLQSFTNANLSGSLWGFTWYWCSLTLFISILNNPLLKRNNKQ